MNASVSRYSMPAIAARPRVAAAGPVRRRVQGEPVSLAHHHVRQVAHRTGDEARHALGRVDGPLARQPHLLAEMLLPRRVVVVALHAFEFLDRTVPPGETGQQAVHHLVPVDPRELLRPAQFPDVRPELVGPLAIRLPTPREPECRNSHTPPDSSTVPSMK